jgi:cellulose synthase/poly-beta-1,6-N-acetylglucosamine synthase-like glycosyltransferase
VQNFTKKQFEIIIVNDHSTDSTTEIVREYFGQFENLKIFELPEHEKGKKAALYKGIKEASHPLVVTTDADCIVGAEWLSTIADYYCQNNKKLCIGPVFITSNTYWEQLQALELSSLIASSAGAAGIHHPIMCNGANLAFSKDVWLEVIDTIPENNASGDDMFLMEAILQKYPGSIGFVKSKKAVVQTFACPNIKTFAQQRARWASKYKFYRNPFIVITALITFFFSFTITLCILLSFFRPHFILLFIFLYALKTLIDWPILRSFNSFFNSTNNLKWYLPLQLVYPLYVTFTALIGILVNFRWKGRSYQ